MDSNVRIERRVASARFKADMTDQLPHRLVLEALPLGIYVVNREGKVVLWSEGAEKLTGFLRQDIVGRLRREAGDGA